MTTKLQEVIGNLWKRRGSAFDAWKSTTDMEQGHKKEYWKPKVITKIKLTKERMNTKQNNITKRGEMRHLRALRLEDSWLCDIKDHRLQHWRVT